MEYSLISVLPTAIVFLFAISFRRDIEPLILGSLVGAILLSGTGFLTTFIDAGYSSFVGETFSFIGQVTLLFGALIGIINKSRGSDGFSTLTAKYVKSQKGTIITTWGLSLFLFIDDYMHSVVVGTTMRKTTDDNHVSRKMLSYMADATAATSAVLIPFTPWAAFNMSIFANSGLEDTLGMSAFSIYVSSIPYFVYAITAIVLALIVGLGLIPKLGTMKKPDVILNQRENDPVEQNEKAKDSKARYFLIPLITVVLAAIITQGDIVYSIYCTIGITSAYYILAKVMTWSELRDAAIDGTKEFLPAAVLLFFTFVLLDINDQIGFTQYVISIAQPYMTPALLPVITFIVVSIVGFCTGSFWGTAAITLPIVISLGLEVDANIFVVLGALVSGQVFGSHACLFGDTTVLSAVGTEIDTLEHGISQLPYAFIGWITTVVIFISLGLIN